MSLFNLYGTEGCHLCEEALALCLTTLSKTDICVVDIVDDEKLVALYRLHIPVLERLADGKKLFWPFSQHDIKELL